MKKIYWAAESLLCFSFEFARALRILHVKSNTEHKLDTWDIILALSVTFSLNLYVFRQI